MKIPKKVTPAKDAANKNNAKGSTGPRSGRGKKRASKNATREGFFARELVLTDEEGRQLTAKRRRLQSQLKPTTELQVCGLDEIVAWTGLCMLALRLEMRRISPLLGQEDTAEQAQSGQPDRARADWYLSGRQGLREGMRLLGAAKEEFLSLGRIDEKWYDLLDKAFGPQLRELLTRWMPSNPVAVMMADQVITHSKTLNLPLHPPFDEKSLARDWETKEKLILDPEQSKQMVIKLLELETAMLSDLWRSVEQRASDAARAQNLGVDFTPRYYSAACRDRHRAIAHYMDLKKNKL
ncbi:MAG: hypothetical protein WB558_15200 [Terriglobales bacterium]